MWDDLFRDVTDPAPAPQELHREEKRRFYVAFVVWFMFMLTGLTCGLLVALVAAFVLINGVDAFWIGGMKAVWRTSSDPEYSSQHNHVGLPLLIALGLLGFFSANALWGRLFVRSGYLSEAAVQRMRLNRAPTERGEKVRAGIGYVLYLAIFLGLGVPMLIFGERTPLQIFSSLGMIGMGVYVAIHAFLRYRSKDRIPKPKD